jgi:branched-subunit amino acid aminotransferase/4-amino-4-deoxychorismate lyase
MTARVLVDGRAASTRDGWDPAVTTYGHFTAMQVRDRRTRGLDFHLARLDDATRELFDVGLHPDLARRRIREALADDVADASVRLYVVHTEQGPSIVVTARPGADPPAGPQRLRCVHYQRPLAHVKHLGGFRLDGLDAQTYFARQAQRDGFDDALFTGPGGIVSEATIANIGFFEGSTVVWPNAPALAGITMQVLQRELTRRGTAWHARSIALADLRSFDGAFLTNSRGIWPVGGIDDVSYRVHEPRMAALHEAYDGAPWDEI